jgi:16S rRNA G966 N2-methylase RsmD
VARKSGTKTGDLFVGDSGQLRVTDKSAEQRVLEKGKVECLGMSFANDDERRNYFIEELRRKLADTEFRRIDGFPAGTDEDILALSDPPFHTACPNPWLKDVIQHYGTPYDSQKPYHCEPFVADISEGKNHPVYNAHSYHTKVPHRAIMRYILHYTQPGDIVLDGFAGTGMAGVAAQFCGDRAEVQALGYQVRDDGTIVDEDGKPFSRLGARRAILNDVSTAATFIAANYNPPVVPEVFERTARAILKEVEDELGWMFETRHTDGKSTGRINFTIWSDVFVCPECGKEIVFWDAAVDEAGGCVQDEFNCPSCAARVTKRACERSWSTSFDRSLNATVRQAKQVPVAINYSFNGKRHEKRPDQADLDTIAKAEAYTPPEWFPSNRMMEGGETRRNDDDGITHVHHFYTARNRAVLAAFWSRIGKLIRRCPTLGLWFTSAHVWATRQNRLLVSNYFKKKGGVIGQTLQGTLYISSIGIETNAIERFGLRIESVPYTAPSRLVYSGTGSTAELGIPTNSVDYLFIDPPFGANIAYSELNYLWESWLRVFTNVAAEAIENRPHGKSLQDYHRLMRTALRECYRILKPGRWITIEFSNTQAAVWNSIQSALGEAGFVVANVSVLEKEHKGFRAVTTPTAVKQDLVISAYKPNGGLEERFLRRGGTEDGIWDFVQTHLRNLPVVKAKNGQIELVVERDPRILYDRMIAFYVGHSTPVPIGASEFQATLAAKFPERDGMYFLPEQVTDYDKKRAHVATVGQLTIFVEDERSAISWLRNFLKERPSIYQDIQPQFMQQLGAGWKKCEAQPELSLLLDQSFLCYEGQGEVPSQIHSYLSSQFKELRNLPKDDAGLRAKATSRWYVPDPNKAGDLEKLREKSLLKEFEGYRASTQKRLKVFRIEAIRAGFKRAYDEKDYRTIVSFAGRLPENILREDETLLMYYDVASMRLGDG